MSSYGAAPALLHTRAQASRLNGAKSRSPKTPQGKARSSQNALKHGLRADKLVLAGEELAEFEALEAALLDELAPEGALQYLLASRIARAAWRLERAERIEGELFEHQAGAGNLGLALIRDGHGSRAFDTLLRYRGSALAELWRALRALKALQAEAAARDAEPGPVPARRSNTDRAAHVNPNEPKARRNPEKSTPSSAVDEPAPPSRPDAGRASRDEPSAPAQPARERASRSDGQVRRPGRSSEYRPDAGRSPPDRDRCMP